MASLVATPFKGEFLENTRLYQKRSALRRCAKMKSAIGGLLPIFFSGSSKLADGAAADSAQSRGYQPGPLIHNKHKGKFAQIPFNQPSNVFPSKSIPKGALRGARHRLRRVQNRGEALLRPCSIGSNTLMYRKILAWLSPRYRLRRN